VETGVCKDTNEVFRKYLTEGKPGYVPHRWATLKDAVHMDHPGRRHGRHCPPGALQIHAQRRVRAVHRIQGPWRRRAWKSSPAATRAAEYVTYAGTAKEFGLAASRGSDFHSPLESHTELGTLPLPARRPDPRVGVAERTHPVTR